MARTALVPGWALLRLLSWPEGLRAYVVLQSCENTEQARRVLHLTEEQMLVICRDLHERDLLRRQPDGGWWIPMDDPRERR